MFSLLEKGVVVRRTAAAVAVARHDIVMVDILYSVLYLAEK